MIVDVHTHIFPDSVAVNAVPKLAQEAGIKESLDGRWCSLLDSMNQHGIDACWLQPVATKPKQVDSINQWMMDIRSDRCVTFGAFHPGYADLPSLIRRLAQNGFPGIKIHPEYHEISPLHESLFPMYEAVIEANRIILFHAGLDIGIPTINSSPAQFAELSERFPDLVMILAHMGGFKQWEEVRKHLVGRNVFLDTSYSLDFLSDEEFVALVRSHGIEQILFGTDSPWADQGKELEHLRQLPFTPEELQKICGSNADALLNKQIKKS